MERLRKNNIHTVNLLAVCLTFQLCFFKNSAVIYLIFAVVLMGLDMPASWLAIVLGFLGLCIVTFVFYLPAKLVMNSMSGRYPLSVKRELPLYPFYIIFFCVSVCLMATISIDCLESVFPSLIDFEYYIPSDIATLIVQFAVFVIFTTAISEAFFRGVVLPVLLPWGRTFAIFAAALAGAAMAQDARQFILYVVIGLLSGYFVSHTGSLWIGIFISLCAKVTVFVHDFILSEGIYGAHPVFFRVVVAVIFAVGIFCCLKADDQMTDSKVLPIRADEDRGRLTDALLAPCAIAYYIIVVAIL